MTTYQKNKTDARLLALILGEMGIGSRQQMQRLEYIKQRRDSAHAEKDYTFLTTLRTKLLREASARVDAAQRHMDRLHRWQRMLLTEGLSPPRRARSRSRSRSPDGKR